MEEEVIQTVLVEVLDEFREVKRQQVELLTGVNELKEKTAVLQTRLATQRMEALPAQTEKVTAAIEDGFAKIYRVIDAQPKRVTKQYRILFFPEYNSREYFKIVGKIWLWVLALIISSYLFLLGKTLILSYPITKEKELAISKYRVAWENLYRTSKKATRLKMD